MEFSPLGNRDGALFKPASNIENVNCLLNELGEQNTRKISSQYKVATKKQYYMHMITDHS